MSVSVLMYHSIEDGTGPTSISERTYRAQLKEIASSGYEVVSLSTIADWIGGNTQIGKRSLAITFDDGLATFETHGAPALKERGWTATVFLPTGYIGREGRWHGADKDSRLRLMRWEQIAHLREEGFEFGSHSVTHPRLPRLSASELDRELSESSAEIERMLGKRPTAFAPPYGSTDRRVQAAIRRYYRVSVSTRLGRATRESDPLDLPRIEMHYFRDSGRWRRYLEGENAYLRFRQALRVARAIPRWFAAAGRAD